MTAMPEVARGGMPLVVGLVVGLTAAGCGGTKTVTVERTVTRVRTVTSAGSAAAACAGDALRGTFAVVPGSAGAGQISYGLRLTNTSGSACFLSGLPLVTLLDAHGAPLPTHPTAARPGLPTAVRVILRPGDSASAVARFSPDVPGVGEGHPGRCEPTAATVRMTAPGGGTVDAPVRPQTPVCEHGALRFSVFSAGR